MKTNQITRSVNDYLLNAIDGEGYGKTLTTDAEKLSFIAHTFTDEYGWAIKQNGVQGAMKEWLSGLPTSINIDFTYHDIIKKAKEFGSIHENASAKQEDKICQNWFNYMAYKLIQLLRKNNINLV